MIKADYIIKSLDELYPDAHCELNYRSNFELLIAVVLSAQTTDIKVNKVTKVLFDKYPDVFSLACANLNDVEEIIKPLGLYHNKAKNIINLSKVLVDKYNGEVINDRKVLESLSGVGRKTTNVVLSILYNEPCIAVDTHVDRVSKRLGFASKKDDVYKVEKKITKLIPKDGINKAHHQMVLFGRYYCKSQKPLCDTCKMKDICKK